MVRIERGLNRSGGRRSKLNAATTATGTALFVKQRWRRSLYARNSQKIRRGRCSVSDHRVAPDNEWWSL